MRKTILFFILFSLCASGLAQTVHDRNAQGNADYQRSMEIRRQNEARRAAEREQERELRNADYWGAFVYLARADWKFFVATNNANENIAKQEALDVCRKQTGRNDCEVVMTFKNTCASIAVDDDHYFPATGHSKKEAERKALAACQRSKGNSVCSIMAKPYCSDYYSAYNKSRPWF